MSVEREDKLQLQRVLTHQAQGSPAGGGFEVQFAAKRIGFGAVVFAEYEAERPAGCGGRGVTGVVFLNSAREILSETHVQVPVGATYEDVDAIGQVLHVAP
jgi:hypothetical protein